MKPLFKSQSSKNSVPKCSTEINTHFGLLLYSTYSMQQYSTSLLQQHITKSEQTSLFFEKQGDVEHF